VSERHGTIVSILVRPARDVPSVVVDQALAIVDRGLQGDRRMRHAKGGKRQVTLVSEEDLRAASGVVGRDIPHALTRRNILVRGLSFHDVTTGFVRCGEALFELCGECDPCARMDRAMGEGARAALEKRGGVVARIVEGGPLRVGDSVVFTNGAQARVSSSGNS
jgi:MOSC domain-containing protein YiiM